MFFIQDAIKFPDIIHAVKPEPDREFPQAQSAHDNFWDFVSLMPESTHMLMWVMSDRAIPRSFRFMEGFGVHSFRFVNEAGVSTFVKFHWKPKLGLQSVMWNEAVKINGADPDFHRRDLWDAITTGNFPEWELGVQLFDDEFADQFDFDILDPTKIIPEELVPVRIVGRLVLDRVVDNFFAETEQVAFCTQNIVRGIDFTNDPLLQGRNFSYLDTQLKRLGSPNFTYLPINAPKCPFAHFQQDGHMAVDESGGTRELRAELVAGRRTRASGRSRTRLRIARDDRGGREAPRPPGQLRRPLQPGPPVPRQPDADRAAAHREGIRLRAQQGRTARHPGADGGQPAQRRRGLRDRGRRRPRTPEDAQAKSKAAKAPITGLPPSPALSIVANGPESFAGRKVGMLVTDGADAALVSALQDAIVAEGAVVEVIAPKIGGATLSDGALLEAQQKIDGGPSVLYDAVAVLASDDGVKDLIGRSGGEGLRLRRVRPRQVRGLLRLRRGALHSGGGRARRWLHRDRGAG